MELLILFILILFNGFFALSEIALVSVKKSRIEHLANKNNRRAKMVLHLLKNPENFLSSVQVGITLIGIISGAYGGAMLTDNMESYLVKLNLPGNYAHEASLVIVIGVITYFSIVIGELVPKSIAMKNAEVVALIIVPIVKYFTLLTYPFVKLLSFSLNIILWLFGIKNNHSEKVNEEDLLFMLKNADRQGVLQKEEVQLHHNLFFFADQKVKSMMTHLSDVEWIDCKKEKEKVLEKIKDSIHSRFLASEGSIENVKGLISIKDFFEKYNDPEFSFDKIIKDPIFIYQNTPVFKVLNLFKSKKQYFAILVDELGKVTGILTLHDIFEAIIGSLPDEDDEDEPQIIKRRDGSYLLDGEVLIYKINQYFQREIIEDDSSKYTTIAGFILNQLKSIPEVGDTIEINHLSFEVVDMDGLKIDKVLMKEILN